ncbi:hypothetical protein ACFQZC_19770 [Streptacidiphilus monticola]
MTTAQEQEAAELGPELAGAAFAGSAEPEPGPVSAEAEVAHGAAADGAGWPVGAVGAEPRAVADGAEWPVGTVGAEPGAVADGAGWPVGAAGAEPEAVAAASEPRRRRRTGLLFGLAVLLGVVGGAGTGYGVQASRPPTPLPPLTVPQPAYPSARAGAPALTADEDDMVRTDGDLTKLLLPLPKGSKLADDIQGWESLSEYAQSFDRPGDAFRHQLELGFRRAAHTSWRTGDVFVNVELSQYQHAAEDSADSYVSDQLGFAADRGGDPGGSAIPGYPRGGRTRVRRRSTPTTARSSTSRRRWPTTATSSWTSSSSAPGRSPRRPESASSRASWSGCDGRDHPGVAAVVPPPYPQTPADPGTPPSPPVGGTRRGRRVALVAAFVLSAVVVGGGAGAGVLALRPQHVAAAPAPAHRGPAYGALADGNHFGSLGDLLLPMPSDYQEGPDDEALGNDTVLGKDQYERYFNEQFRDLKSGDRKKLQALLDLSHIRGYALRSYAADSDDFVAEISLLQENQQRAKQSAEWTKAFADATGVFRTGPAIDGFPHARCYLPGPARRQARPHDLHRRRGRSAHHHAGRWRRPLNTASAAALFKQQLTRLAIPAAAI